MNERKANLRDIHKARKRAQRLSKQYQKNGGRKLTPYEIRRQESIAEILKFTLLKKIVDRTVDHYKREKEQAEIADNNLKQRIQMERTVFKRYPPYDRPPIQIGDNIIPRQLGYIDGAGAKIQLSSYEANRLGLSMVELPKIQIITVFDYSKNRSTGKGNGNKDY
ncbi:hypothetical protein HYT02_01955 [Candidatus Gottesmanbacteria bacterium]|nr:hypothetical protein [Candidatus Gottesmanbacteria bacterium]